MAEHIPVFRPSLDPESVWRELRPVIESGWLGQGHKVEELETKLAAKVGAKHFVTTSSCTAALHLAVHCLDLPRGSRVLTSPITFVSTNAVLLWEGLIPVFGEVTYDGLLKGPHGAYGTVATMVVHLGGDLYPIAPYSPARRDGKFTPWPVIEDCAHALGAPWANKQGHNMRCWSFHAVKGLPMGDGGGISTDDDALASRLRKLRWMGIDKSTHARSRGGYSTDYDIPELGWKYHMNDITAAIGLAALPLVDEQVKRRQEIALKYLEGLASPHRAWPSPGTRKTLVYGRMVDVPISDPEDSACHFYPLFFENREAVEASLRVDNIAFSRHYKPNFMYAPFLNFTRSEQATASALEYYRTALVLPIFPSMTDEQVDRVIAAVRRAL